jgi:hypothetical protein
MGEDKKMTRPSSIKNASTHDRRRASIITHWLKKVGVHCAASRLASARNRKGSVTSIT